MSVGSVGVCTYSSSVGNVGVGSVGVCTYSNSVGSWVLYLLELVRIRVALGS